MQILVVEDDSRISEFLVKGLVENGYFVTHCQNAEEVLENYIRKTWDLIIIDIMLPKMNGFNLVETLRFKKNLSPLFKRFNEEEKIENVLSFGGLKIDTERYELSLNGEAVELSPREFKLLRIEK
ncbi:response regulator transcription factor [Frigoriflavimonas asaccharolytica]|uniref:DNA-binding response OmpR family regulator n=1 Tax=Frigoriflavimonas asaccharolytica TaxID=2735899 RepID=A0A8J8K8Q5_9FLAO|nr:response regulator transcription factor [Frigoriflavimonas asaccharolytica]NRS92851.1 DNA-binding response OmpR family regulator [Frigoriflavimonas asaccharolytica]